MKVKVFNRQGQLVGPVEMPPIVKTDAQWREQLTPEQFEVARGKGTERPFCGTLLDNKRPGVYTCVCCGLPLFTSRAKFHSGTGWPSFFQPVASENVVAHDDRTYGMVRT
jgi:methionine-R-sulfoxide reductase